MTKPEDQAARALIPALGHSPDCDWERVFAGGYGQDEPNDLASLCRTLARTAIAQYLQPGRPQEDMALFEEVECALALFRELKRTPGEYTAVKIDGPAGWTAAKPRTQQAMRASLATAEEMAKIRMEMVEVVKNYTMLDHFAMQGMLDRILSAQGLGE